MRRRLRGGGACVKGVSLKGNGEALSSSKSLLDVTFRDKKSFR